MIWDLREEFCGLLRVAYKNMEETRESQAQESSSEVKQKKEPVLKLKKQMLNVTLYTSVICSSIVYFYLT